MAGQTATQNPTQELNLQARLEQLEAELATAHEQLDRMAPRGDTPGAAEAQAPGAAAAAIRCEGSAGRLSARIRELADGVGLI